MQSKSSRGQPDEACKVRGEEGMNAGHMGIGNWDWMDWMVENVFDFPRMVCLMHVDAETKSKNWM